MKHAVFALALLAALAGLSPAGAAAYPMAGVWFGTGQPNDRSEMYIDYFNADGSFHNQHRECRQGKIASDLRETGHWTIARDILTIDIATVDGKPDPRTDRYRLISVDAKTQKYVVLPSNFPYNAHRMAVNFSMPPCDLTS